MADCASATQISIGRSEISRQFLDEMRQNLGKRRMRDGLRRLEEQTWLFEELSPEQKHSASFVGCCAQWVDAGFRDAEVIRKLLARFPEEARAGLPLVDYAHLRLAEGFLAGKEETPGPAIHHFEFVIGIGNVLRGPTLPGAELVAVAHYWKANCH